MNSSRSDTPEPTEYLGRDDPKLGAPNDRHRRCGYRIGGPVGDGEQLCGKPASTHLIFRWDEPTISDPDAWDHGYTCDDHYEASIKLRHVARHPLTEPCGMPGSRCHMPENECRWDPDGLLVIAEAEGAAVHA